MFDSNGFVPRLRRLGAKVMVGSTIVGCANAEAPAGGPSPGIGRADDGSRTEGSQAHELKTSDLGSTVAGTDSDTEECVTALPDARRVLKRTGPHRFTLERWAIDTYFRHCLPTPTRTTWPPKFGEPMTVDAAPGTLWHAIGLKTGDELVAVGPMVISANLEVMLDGYRQLVREPRQGVVLRTRRQGRELPKLTIDVIGP